MCRICGGSYGSMDICCMMLYNQIMNKFIRSFLTLLFAGMFLSAFFATPVLAQAGDGSQYFPDTGHTVSGEFWKFYQSNDRMAFLAGSPITEQFVDPQTSRTVQYFQRARFEYYPENLEGERVKLTSLGALVLEHFPPSDAPNIFTPFGCRAYPENRVFLCYDFLQYYDRNGGEDVFGKPLTSIVSHNDRLVQYFERARFEWYPDYGEGQKVVLAQLGRVYFDMLSSDASLLLPVRQENAPSDVRDIHVRAYTYKSLTYSNDTQIVFVSVQDQTFSPVSGAELVLTLRWPDGSEERFFRRSNGSGIVVYPFDVHGQKRGQMVMVNAHAEYAGLVGDTVASFRIWK